MNNLHAISPLDGRYSNKLIELNEIVSEFGLIRYRVRVEIEWFKFLLKTLFVDIEHTILDQIVVNFAANDCIRIKEIEQTTNHDVKAIEYYLKEKIEATAFNQYKEHIHFACTSEDINNLSYALMLKDSKDIIVNNLDKLINSLMFLVNKHKDDAMLCRTHGQAATPSTMGKELYNFVYRLKRQLKQLKHQEILGKINGTVGNYNAHVVAYPEIDWFNLSKNFIEDILGITFNPYTTQIEPHDFIAEFFDNIRRINIILLDLTRDIWGYISINYFLQKVRPNEVGSSTMPHKVNPIDFENSEGNLAFANSLTHFLADKLPISRWQRDLSDSTVLRNIGVVISHSLLGYKSLINGLNKIELNSQQLNFDLDHNWQILAEPIQTIMRRANFINPYEKLKELTRGKNITQAIIREYILSLDISKTDKNTLLKLTPHNYIGLASKLLDNNFI